jgi:hypothetical protein
MVLFAQSGRQGLHKRRAQHVHMIGQALDLPATPAWHYGSDEWLSGFCRVSKFIRWRCLTINAARAILPFLSSGGASGWGRGSANRDQKALIEARLRPPPKSYRSYPRAIPRIPVFCKRAFCSLHCFGDLSDWRSSLRMLFELLHLFFRPRTAIRQSDLRGQRQIFFGFLTRVGPAVPPSSQKIRPRSECPGHAGQPSALSQRVCPHARQ